MANKTINYESDFKIIEGFKDGSSILAAPFRFSYYTKVSRGVYVAEYDGKEYKNCIPTDDGRVIVPFDSPKLGMGVLSVKREFFLNDSDYKDGICNLVSVEGTGIMLDRGATDMDGEVNIELFPFYQRGENGKSAYDLWIEEGNEGSVADFLASLKGAKGDDGESFTYEDMTDEQKEDLASHIEIPEDSITESKLSQEVRDKLNQESGGGYQPPVGGIPKRDLSQEVQTSLGKADTALQEHQDLSEYAKKSDIPTDYAKKSEVPTKVSQLQNDSNYTTLSQVQEIADGLVKKDAHTSEIHGLQKEIEEVASTMLTTEPAEGEEVEDFVLMLSDVEQSLGDSAKPISQAAVKSAINSIESMIVSVINTPI